MGTDGSDGLDGARLPAGARLSAGALLSIRGFQPDDGRTGDHPRA